MAVSDGCDNDDDIGRGGGYDGVLWLWTMVRILVVVVAVMAVCYSCGQW